MKKIAIVAPQTLPVPPLRGGGIQNGIWEIIKHFKKYEIHIISAYDPKLDKLPSYEQHNNIYFHRIYLPQWKKDLINFFYAKFNFHYPYARVSAKILNKVKPDIVHIRSRLWLLPYYKKLLRFPHKTILHHHNHYFVDMKEEKVKEILNDVDAFVGVSDYTVKIEVSDRFPEYKKMCTYIHNGIDVDKFLPRPKLKDAQLLEQLKIKVSDIVFIFVGRLSPSKGVHTILKAFNKMIPDNPDLKLMIVGSSWFGENKENEYTTLLKELTEPIKDNVIFTGFVGRDKIQEYYRLADCYIGPSVFHDPSPNTCYESSAMELPIIASKRGGIPEIILEGKTGILVDDPEDENELYDKIGYFLSHFEEMITMGRNARQRMIDKFTWKHAAHKTEKLYAKLLRQKRNI